LQVNIINLHFKVVSFIKIIIILIIRACRVLRQARGHLLLIGLDGTGKTTIMGLAATISNCEMVKLNVKKGYCFTDFRDDLKAIFKIAGAQKRKVTFFIDDKDIYEVIYNFCLNKLKLLLFINYN
jgi:dynein heavy chain, axonemal